MKISFPETFKFDDLSVRYVQGTTGLYFIFLKEPLIPYPFQGSGLIYIGMSDSKQNSIGNRLRDHKSGQSGNFGIKNYANQYPVLFTYLSLEMLKALGCEKAVALESYFLENFANFHGTYPICNNQSGIELEEQLHVKGEIQIDWPFFF